MKRTLCAAGLATFFVVAWTAPAGALKCPADSVKVGTGCIDRYEASVWQINPANTTLVKLAQKGNVTLADLIAGGATPLGCFSGQTAYPGNFPLDANWTPVPASNPPSPGVYAVSIPNVLPSTCISWFQANQACLLSGKRLLTNREWQGVAAGTPDPGTDNGTSDCSVNSVSTAVNTGSRASCVSRWGAFDMVGNIEEWVADWGDLADFCGNWTTQTGIGGNDLSCFAGPGGSSFPTSFRNIPGALVRGGSWGDGSDAGVFKLQAGFNPSTSQNFVGFRCAR